MQREIFTGISVVFLLIEASSDFIGDANLSLVERNWA